MIKVEKNNQKINPFWGINFVIDEIKLAGISELIEKPTIGLIYGRQHEISKHPYRRLGFK